MSVPHLDPQVELELALALALERAADPRAGHEAINAAASRAKSAFERWSALPCASDLNARARVQERFALLRATLQHELHATARRVELAELAKRALSSQAEPARSVAGCDHSG
ncbi:MAG: hypothetical protein ACKO4Q_00070 [Planctomycetota bacterium]